MLTGTDQLRQNYNEIMWLNADESWRELIMNFITKVIVIKIQLEVKIPTVYC